MKQTGGGGESPERWKVVELLSRASLYDGSNETNTVTISSDIGLSFGHLTGQANCILTGSEYVPLVHLRQ